MHNLKFAVIEARDRRYNIVLNLRLGSLSLPCRTSLEDLHFGATTFQNCPRNCLCITAGTKLPENFPLQKFFRKVVLAASSGDFAITHGRPIRAARAAPQGFAFFVGGSGSASGTPGSGFGSSSSSEESPSSSHNS